MEFEKTRPSPKEHPVAERNPRKNAEKPEHFSPDPYGRTDRYRLVTPYRLPAID